MEYVKLSFIGWSLYPPITLNVTSTLHTVKMAASALRYLAIIAVLVTTVFNVHSQHKKKEVLLKYLIDEELVIERIICLISLIKHYEYRIPYAIQGR